MYKRYKEFKNLKISYIHKTFLLSSICDKCCNQDKKIFEVEVWIEILQFLGLINNM